MTDCDSDEDDADVGGVEVGGDEYFARHRDRAAVDAQRTRVLDHTANLIHLQLDGNAASRQRVL